ncbi:MAG: iron ABC transporter permease, partial [Aminobacterium sp.]|nr:iron ABC transporter permease [Aminobacterium sp.]
MKYLSSNNTKRLDRSLIAVLVVLWALLGLFVLYPLMRLLYIVFIVEGSFTLSNLSEVFTNWYNRKALLDSLILATSVAISG